MNAFGTGTSFREETILTDQMSTKPGDPSASRQRLKDLMRLLDVDLGVTSVSQVGTNGRGFGWHRMDG